MSKSQYVDWEFGCQNSNLPVSWCWSNLWLDLLVATPWINKGKAATNLQLWSPSATWKDCVLLLFPFFFMCDFCLPLSAEFRQRMVTARVQKCLTDPIHPPNALMNQIIHAFRILFLLCNVLCCCWCSNTMDLDHQIDGRDHLFLLEVWVCFVLSSINHLFSHKFGRITLHNGISHTQHTFY